MFPFLHHSVQLQQPIPAAGGPGQNIGVRLVLQLAQTAVTLLQLGFHVLELTLIPLQHAHSHCVEKGRVKRSHQQNRRYNQKHQNQAGVRAAVVDNAQNQQVYVDKHQRGGRKPQLAFISDQNLDCSLVDHPAEYFQTDR